MELLVIIVIVIILFAAAFITKRRFGLLGLALAAGSIISGIWGYEAGLIPSLFSIPAGSITSTVVASVLILLPAGVLLFHGYHYKSLIGRIIGASLFTILATAFLIEPISRVIVLQGANSEVFTWILRNKDTIIGIGLVVAVIDLFLTKPVHLHNKHHKG